jgi:FG-GAP-like repeat/ASPIC and UnbV
VGACWFDMDGDGDLDLFTANQNGDRDGLFRNDQGKFQDIAIGLNMDQPRRPVEEGSVGCAVTDFDTDGDLDLYVATYGNDLLYRNNGDGSFTDVAAGMGVKLREHMVSGAWGDVQNDGRPDLYTVGYVWGEPGRPDYLFINEGTRFTNQVPAIMVQHDGDHSVQWADFDQDGDLDLALTNSDPSGSHFLFRNELPQSDASRSIQVLVLDANGHYTRAGSEVRIYTAGTSELLGLRLVDTGNGYNSQNALPVHIGLGTLSLVDIRITTMSAKSPAQGPRTWEFKGIDSTSLGGKPFVAKVGD